MNIALVHDYLREYGGAERVLEAMHEIWPEAPLYSSFVDWEALGNQAYRFKDWDIRTSPIADNWLVRTFHSPLRFLAPKIWNSFDLSGYDVVVTSSGWFMCRGVRVKKPTVHICYIHHPPRNLYGYATGSSLQKYWPVRLYATVVNFYLRHYDFETAQRVDYFIANSKETARRVEKFYRRKSEIIYPPVELRTQNSMTNTKRSYFLSVGRLTYSKRVDLAIQAANKLKLPLKVVGTGAEEKYLRSLAGPTVEFLGSVSDSELAELYAGAKALIFCALDEDFGIVPVEAMAYGTPVIALAQGGVLETIVPRKTGVLFNQPTVDSLLKAIRQFTNLPMSQSDCIVQAKKFEKARFQNKLKAFVEEKFTAP
ncbi:glycosyltransferase [Candidatus Gottesmanbacteria bacterium]|nr:glycosyltransferase [Candidatus Gottesmanbacteria bacterium]